MSVQFLISADGRYFSLPAITIEGLGFVTGDFTLSQISA
jgi:hypothetical protein